VAFVPANVRDVQWVLPHAEQLRSYLPPAVMTLAAGMVMMLAGYLLHADGWTVAGLVMLPAGVLISIAFVLARRIHSPVPGGGASLDRRTRLLILLGLPSAGGDLSRWVSVAVSVVMLAAGALMTVAGYAAAAWSGMIVPPLVLLSGLVILAGFVITYRADRAGDVSAIRDGWAGE
jgi:hypothetical protein